jgi:hypothetical protein
MNTSALGLLSLGLGIGASAAAVAAGLRGLGLLVRRRWDQTIGRRHAQARILDELACTTSLAFIETKLGVPQFITHPYGGDREERIYRLPGAWVAVEAKGGAVRLFSITITDPNMYYNVDGMTLGVVPLRLGKDTFAQARDSGDEQLWIGARQAGYVRYYYAGNPGGYQHYWLSFNAAGAGRFKSHDRYASGIYGNEGDKPPDPATITANTLAVLSPEAGLDDEVKRRYVFGPHVDQLRLVWFERKKLNAPSTPVKRLRAIGPALRRRLYPSGRCTSIVYPLLRSTRVPIAVRLRCR